MKAACFTVASRIKAKSRLCLGIMEKKLETAIVYCLGTTLAKSNTHQEGDLPPKPLTCSYWMQWRACGTTWSFEGGLA